MIELSADIDPISEKPPLLLLHGMMSSRNHWRLNEGLARHFRRIRVELPGHGLSPATDDPADYAPDALVAALDHVRVRLGIDRWYICGQSFGAALTLRYALDRPEHVVAQAFSNASAAFGTEPSPEWRKENAARIADMQQHGREALRRFRFHPAHARRFQPDIREQLTHDADNASLTGIVNLFRFTLPALSIRSRFGSTQVPTLLVNGRYERAFQPVRDFAAASLPGITVVDLEGGHSINVEQPAAFDEALCQTLLKKAPSRHSSI